MNPPSLNFRHIVLNVGIFFSLFLCSICSPQTSIADGPRLITAGVLLDLSGPTATFGEECRAGIEVARAHLAPGDKVSNYSVKFIYGDTKAEPRLALSEFQKMVSSDKACIIIANRTPIALALNPLSLKQHIPLLATSAHPKFIVGNDYGFRFWSKAETEGEALAKKAISLGHTKFAIITTEDDYLLALTEGFTKTLTSLGGTVVYNEQVEPSISDLSSIATKMKGSSADALFINLSLQQAAIMFRRLPELGVTQARFSNFWVAMKDVVTGAGAQNVEGAIFVEPVFNEHKKFLNELSSKHALNNPTAIAFNCYNMAAYFLSALTKDPNVSDNESLYRSLLSTHDAIQLDGILPVRDREAQIPVGYKKMVGGIAVPIG